MKKIMKTFRFLGIKILFIAVLISCKRKKEELEYLICKDSIQYWNCYFPRENAEKWTFTFSFDKDKNVLKYSYAIKSNERWLFSDYADHGAMESDKWTITKDSILTFMENSKKIYKISKNQDTIYAIGIDDGVKIKYVRVRGDLNIQKPTPRAKLIINKKEDTINNK